MIAGSRVAQATGHRVAWTPLGTGSAPGIALELATFRLARYGPSGGGGDVATWSFRGNGALVVPFGVGHAILAGRWVLIVLHSRGVTSLLKIATGAAAIGVILTSAGAASVVVGGPISVLATQVATPLVRGWPIIASALAVLFRFSHDRVWQNPVSHAAAGVLFAAAMIAGFWLAAAVFPPGS